MEIVSTELGGNPLKIEVGRIARQASGSALVRYGETVVLVTAVAEKESKDLPFFPLSVHYVEKHYAAGRIPGGFLRREGRLSDNETLISRFIDRSIRPLFPTEFQYETQIIATVLSYDKKNEAGVAAMIGTSVALSISDIPFAGPIAGMRVGRIDGKLIVNPTPDQLAESELDIFVTCSKEGLLMVEGEANEISEDLALEAILFAQQQLLPVIELQEELQKKVGLSKRALPEVKTDEALAKNMEAQFSEPLLKSLSEKEKLARYDSLNALSKQALEKFYDPQSDEEPRKKEVEKIFGNLKKRLMREQIASQGTRVDGRSQTDIREINSEIGLLPRCHGSALFTRGETQALVNVTLGARSDEQLIDNLHGVSFKDFLFHYNFPPFCVGEASFLRAPGRREIGHGMLAQKGIKPLLPSKEKFPYTIRITSEILESNGSSSMASVCGASLALMDAGVPISKHAAGIAMGLIKEGTITVILSDILGDEDHLGDMDFKVAGTREGITALQMDIKVSGIDENILAQALKQALDGRINILDEMEKTITSSKKELSPYAPVMLVHRIKPGRIGELIGPSGKTIKSIIEKTGAKVDVQDDGTVQIHSENPEAAKEALKMVENITAEVEIGAVYKGPVKKVTDFGAFIELLPGTDGLLHISQMAEGRVERVEDFMREGDIVSVRVSGTDKRGKLKLTRYQE